MEEALDLSFDRLLMLLMMMMMMMYYIYIYNLRLSLHCDRMKGMICNIYTLIIIIIIIIIFINCNWVVTRWQCLFYMYTKHETGY